MGKAAAEELPRWARSGQRETGISLAAVPVASACFRATVVVEGAGAGPERVADLRVRVSAAPSEASGAAGPADEPVVLFPYRDAASAGSYVALRQRRPGWW